MNINTGLKKFLAKDGRKVGAGTELVLREKKKKITLLTEATVGVSNIVLRNIDDLRTDATLLRKFQKHHNIRIVMEDVGAYTLMPKDVKIEDFENKMRQRCKAMTILAFDPGTRNMAYTVLKVERPFRVSILETGMIEHTFSDMKGDVNQKIAAFLSEVNKLKRKYRPDTLIAERYMTRGVLGTTIECVNVMLGAMLATSKFDRFKLIPAAQWKNEYNKHRSLEDAYAVVRGRCEVHQVDSMGIGLYGACYWFGIPPYAQLTAKFEQTMLQQLANANKV